MKRMIISMVAMLAATSLWASTTNSFKVAVNSTNSTSVIYPLISRIDTNTSSTYTNNIAVTFTNMFTNVVSLAVNTIWMRVIGDDFYCDTDPDSGGATTNSAFYHNGDILEWEQPVIAPRYIRVLAANSNATAYVQRTLR